MPSAAAPSPYILSYRNEDSNEHQRLNTQHHVIQHAILSGHLIHPSVTFPSSHLAIADVACGTGIWLDDVRRAIATPQGSSPPQLVGFDVNDHAFDTTLDPSIKLIKHDCTEEFPAEYVGQFDLVNIRGLAFAIPEEKFIRLVANVIHLLRPGGYLQWLETDSRLFQQLPVTPSFEKAIAAINVERRKRGLVQNLPHFMLREMTKFTALDAAAPVEILHFNLLPGGICRDPTLRTDSLNRRFSETILESVKVALAGLVLGGQKASGDGASGNEGKEPAVDVAETQALVEAIEADKSSPDIVAGGMFPHLVARRSEV